MTEEYRYSLYINFSNYRTPNDSRINHWGRQLSEIDYSVRRNDCENIRRNLAHQEYSGARLMGLSDHDANFWVTSEISLNNIIDDITEMVRQATFNPEAELTADINMLEGINERFTMLEFD